jgi:NAD(P)H-dependent flavin oxidoreductase YrpB (nitropropane dioxygenase family)
VVDLCRDKKSPLTGEPIYVVAAGGIYNGRGLAAALCWGAQAVWVGTRFVCAKVRTDLSAIILNTHL